jgi:hypothetical protein
MEDIAAVKAIDLAILDIGQENGIAIGDGLELDEVGVTHGAFGPYPCTPTVQGETGQPTSALICIEDGAEFIGITGGIKGSGNEILKAFEFADPLR